MADVAIPGKTLPVDVDAEGIGLQLRQPAVPSSQQAKRAAPDVHEPRSFSGLFAQALDDGVLVIEHLVPCLGDITADASVHRFAQLLECCGWSGSPFPVARRSANALALGDVRFR